MKSTITYLVVICLTFWLNSACDPPDSQPDDAPDVQCDNNCLDSTVFDVEELESELEDQSETQDSGLFGDLCNIDTDCLFGLCLIEGDATTGICTRFCNDDCPDGWRCVLYTNSGAEATHLCVRNKSCDDDDGDGYGEGETCLGPDCNDSDAEIYPGADETCDGLDNDCDSIIDDGFTVGILCTEGIGACESTGVVQCSEDGKQTECMAEAGEGTDEICDGLDNDCDGEVDEDVLSCCQPGDVISCGLEIGACTSGNQTCSEDLAWGVCLDSQGIGIVQPLPEICNAIDDDCNGVVDDSFNLGIACVVGTGACENTGENVCNNSGDGVICDAQPGLAEEEVCDGADNNCDGHTDEELGSIQCGLGECEQIIPACYDGVLQVCDPMEGSSEEICDGIDNDCDGEIDNGDWNDTCDDDDPCTLNVCEQGECQNPQAPDGTPCDDGEFCTHPDLCFQGSCPGGPLENQPLELNGASEVARFPGGTFRFSSVCVQNGARIELCDDTTLTVTGGTLVIGNGGGSVGSALDTEVIFRANYSGSNMVYLRGDCSNPLGMVIDSGFADLSMYCVGNQMFRVGARGGNIWIGAQASITIAWPITARGNLNIGGSTPSASCP